MQGTHQRFGRGALQKRTRLGVDRGAEKIVWCGVANVEPNRRIEPGQLRPNHFCETGLSLREEWRRAPRRGSP